MTIIFYLFALFIDLQIGFYGISANLRCQNQSTGEIVEYLEGNFWAESYKNVPQDPLIEQLMCDLSLQDFVIIEGSRMIDSNCRAQDEQSMAKSVDLFNNLRHWMSVVKNVIVTSSDISLQNNAIQQLKVHLAKLAILLGQNCQISAQEIVPIKEFTQGELLQELAILWFQNKGGKREENDKDRCKSERRLVQLMANLANEDVIGDLGKAKDRRRRRRKKRGDNDHAVLAIILIVLGIAALTLICWGCNRGFCNPSSAAPGGGSVSVKEGSVKSGGGGGSIKAPSSNGGSSHRSSSAGLGWWTVPDFVPVPAPPAPARNPPLFESLFYPWTHVPHHNQHGQP